MTNFDETNSELIDSDLTEVYLADVPNMRFDASLAERQRESWTRRVGAWRPAVAAVGVAAALAAVLIAPGLLGGQSQTVSAAEVFERASEAAAPGESSSDASYHLVATQSIHGAADVFEIETWYGSEGRFRVEYRDSQDDGAGYVFGQVVNRDEAWLYQVLDGVTYAVHGPSSALGVDMTGASVRGGTSLAEVLAQYSGHCQTAALNGESEVAGRAVYEVLVTPDGAACEMAEERMKAESLAGTSLRLWVDQETFLTLEMQQIDATDIVVSSQTASVVEIGEGVDASVFEYQAPDGTTVAEATDITSAKNALGPTGAASVEDDADCTVTTVAEDGSKREEPC